MMPSPMRDDHQRSTNDRPAVATAAPTISKASLVTLALVPSGMSGTEMRSTICLKSSTGTRAMSASSTMMSR